jgi:hypothetical protein
MSTSKNENRPASRFAGRACVRIDFTSTFLGYCRYVYQEVMFMATSVHTSHARWRDYVASAYLQRISSDTRDYNPGKGGRIYRRYDYTIEAVGILAEARRRARKQV